MDQAVGRRVAQAADGNHRAVTAAAAADGIVVQTKLKILPTMPIRTNPNKQTFSNGMNSILGGC